MLSATRSYSRIGQGQSASAYKRLVVLWPVAEPIAKVNSGFGMRRCLQPLIPGFLHQCPSARPCPSSKRRLPGNWWPRRVGVRFARVAGQSDSGKRACFAGSKAGHRKGLTPSSMRLRLQRWSLQSGGTRWPSQAARRSYRWWSPPTSGTSTISPAIRDWIGRGRGESLPRLRCVRVRW